MGLRFCNHVTWSAFALLFHFICLTDLMSGGIVRSRTVIHYDTYNDGVFCCFFFLYFRFFFFFFPIFVFFFFSFLLFSCTWQLKTNRPFSFTPTHIFPQDNDCACPVSFISISKALFSLILTWVLFQFFFNFLVYNSCLYNRVLTNGFRSDAMFNKPVV